MPKKHKSHADHKRNIRLSDPRQCCTCGVFYLPRAYNQTACDPCRIAAGVRVYPIVEPTDIDSFFETEAERRARLDAIKHLQELNSHAK